MTREASSNTTSAGQAGPTDARRGLVADWLTIWQSELAAMAVDRENAEHFEAVLAAWLAAAAAIRPHEPGAARSSGADATAGAATSVAASDARETIDGARRRLAELGRSAEPRYRDDLAAGDLTEPAAG